MKKMLLALVFLLPYAVTVFAVEHDCISFRDGADAVGCYGDVLEIVASTDFKTPQVRREAKDNELIYTWTLRNINPVAGWSHITMNGQGVDASGEIKITGKDSAVDIVMDDTAPPKEYTATLDLTAIWTGDNSTVASASANISFTVVKVEITPETNTVCAVKGGEKDYDLTADSYAPGGVTWSIAPQPAGMSINADGTVTIPPNCPPGYYTVTATSKDAPSCKDTAKLTVLKVDIVKPQGSLDANPNPVASWLATTERFDFQGIKAGVPGAYVLDIKGEIEPIPPASYKWTLDPAAGTLANDTTVTPTHTAPATEGEGTLTLKAMVGTTDIGCKDEGKVKIYKDCLERDKANFGTGISCANPWSFTRFNVTINMNSTWNCHGSSVHLYDGSGDGTASGIGFASSWAVVKTVTVTHVDGGGGSHPSLGTLSRGDLVVYYTSGGDLMHSQTCTGNGTETYGANNEPLSYPGAPTVNESYKWAASTAGDWANDLWQPDFPPPYNTMPNIMPVTIEVRGKP